VCSLDSADGFFLVHVSLNLWACPPKPAETCRSRSLARPSLFLWPVPRAAPHHRTIHRGHHPLRAAQARARMVAELSPYSCMLVVRHCCHPFIGPCGCRGRSLWGNVTLCAMRSANHVPCPSCSCSQSIARPQKYVSTDFTGRVWRRQAQSTWNKSSAILVSCALQVVEQTKNPECKNKEIRCGDDAGPAQQRRIAPPHEYVWSRSRPSQHSGYAMCSLSGSLWCGLAPCCGATLQICCNDHWLGRQVERCMAVVSDLMRVTLGSSAFFSARE